LNPDLCELINYASEIGYTYIEVYTNLIRLPSDLVQAAQRTGARFATSIYSSDAAMHDAVTARSGSHARTISNLKRLIKLGIPVRAGFVETDFNAGHWERTEAFLEGIGVDKVGYDVMRGFGRGTASPGQCDAGELCGRCWDERLCVAPDGSVSPCIMSKAWGLGNIRDASVKQIAFSSETADTRSWLHANRGGRIELVQALPGDECAPGPSKEKRFCVPGEEQKSCAPELSREKEFCGPGREKGPGEGAGPCMPHEGCDPGPREPQPPEKELPRDKPAS
jgi:radical SAM protein with 4Fe4S-binding SPASM domain